MSMYAPLVGFGDPDDPVHFARFGVEIQGNEDVYPDWNAELITSTRQIAGSSNIVTQVMGQGPARLTLRIWFDDRDAYRRFRRYHGTSQTLSLLAGFTSHDGAPGHHLGLDYDRYPNTMLERIEDVQNRIGGAVECRATFLRASPEVATW